MRKHRSVIIALVVLALAGVAGYYVYRFERQRQTQLDESARQTLDPEASALAKGASPDLPVRLYLYQSGKLNPNADFLYVQEGHIFETTDTVLKARQIINEVLKSRPLFTDAAKLRQIYLLEDGTAVVDVSEQTVAQLSGGVVSEMAAIMSMTRSLRANIQEIKRVRFLVEGQETETFSGHVSIGEPFM